MQLGYLTLHVNLAVKFPNKLFFILYFPQISSNPEGHVETA